MKYRRLSLLGAGMLLGMLALFLLRGRLTHAAVTAGLKRAGAGDILMDVVKSTPWSVQLENLAFKVKTHSFAARRITMERSHWWQPTLGSVRIEGARVPVTIDGSSTSLIAPASSSEDGAETPAGGGLQIPLEKISIDGQLIVRTSGHEQPLALKFSAQPDEKNIWNGTLQATGPGFTLAAEASYRIDNQQLSFRTTTFSAELKPWQDVVQQVMVMPMGPWTMDGKFSGEVSGTYAKQKLTVAGRINLQQGTLKNSDGSLQADGIESGFEFTDLTQFQSNPGIVRVRVLRVGVIEASELDAEIAFVSTEQLAINRLTLKILGGSLAAEPFQFAVGRRELEAVVVADNLDVEKILALSKDVPAQGTGRVDGRLPLRLDEHGLRLGTGWLQLRKGVYAEMQIKAAGLMTSGMSPKTSGYVVMKRIEDGLLRLKLGALRLDVRPPDAQRGQSARLHLEGEPVDPSVKAPVILDVNVNGPLEQLLNFGLKQDVSFGVGQR